MSDNKERYEIAAYRSFGNSERVLIKGRILKDKGILPANVTDGSWRNLINMLRRFESDEFPFARVEIRWRDQVQNATADSEGYFEAWIHNASPISEENLWEEAVIQLLWPESDPPLQATSMVFIPSSKAQFGIVSDLDDTVIQTGATSYVRMIKTILLANARTRLPFEGVAAFYRALQEGVDTHARNPLFYVSSSPWNLYDLLLEFLEYQKIPIGPVLLRDWGIDRRASLPTHHKQHKLATVNQILEMYPELRFILIGDSGQDDPEIYSEIAIRHRGRILAIYIRDVSREEERKVKILQLSENVQTSGTTMMLTPDTKSAALHAAKKGWILPL